VYLKRQHCCRVVVQKVTVDNDATSLIEDHAHSITSLQPSKPASQQASKPGSQLQHQAATDLN